MKEKKITCNVTWHWLTFTNTFLALTFDITDIIRMVNYWDKVRWVPLLILACMGAHYSLQLGNEWFQSIQIKAAPSCDQYQQRVNQLHTQLHIAQTTLGQLEKVIKQSEEVFWIIVGVIITCVFGYAIASVFTSGGLHDNKLMQYPPKPAEQTYLRKQLEHHLTALTYQDETKFAEWYFTVMDPSRNPTGMVTHIEDIPKETILEKPKAPLENVSHFKFQNPGNYYLLLIEWCRLYEKLHANPPQSS